MFKKNKAFKISIFVLLPLLVVPATFMTVFFSINKNDNIEVVSNTPITENTDTLPPPMEQIDDENLEIENASIKVDKNEIVTTNLPAMFISLFDENNEKVELSSVNREEYVSSSITITNTEEEYCFNDLQSSFKGRGNGSWWEAKKGYKIKLDKKTSLFGRTKNKHWVLNACAQADDKTIYRNYLAYNMGSTIFDNIEYTTNAIWIDVYVNNIYQGVYVLCEHVRVDQGRVDIQSNYGELDTGYLIEYDAYAGGIEDIDYFRIDGVKYPFTVHSPDPEEYSTDGNISELEYREQINYIKNYVQNVYNAALQKDFETFSTLADVDSFVDMYILQELFKNSDAGWSSFYLYKKPGGKLYAGPAWDFDFSTIATYDEPFPEGIYIAGTVQQNRPICANELLIALYNTEGFKNLVIQRWQQLSPNIENFINSKMNSTIYNEILYAMSRNLSLWKDVTMGEARNIWLNEVEILKNWFDGRIAFLNNEWK